MSCGPRTYDNIQPHHVVIIKEKLAQKGATIEGNNPYRIDTHNHDVIIFATYDEQAKAITIRTEEPFYVSCSKIFETIDPLIDTVREIPAPSAVATTEPSKMRPELIKPELEKLKKAFESIDKVDVHKGIQTAGDQGKVNVALYAAGGVATLGALYWLAKRR